MAKTPAKVKKAAPTPLETTPEKRTLKSDEIALSPTIKSAVGILAWSKFAGEVDLSELLENLRTRAEKVHEGDMRPVETMLYGQAMTLETIFTSLARRATSQEDLKQFQTYLGLALKAQAQCRATLEALAEIKNPRPVAFVKQANISGGPQQVNNGIKPAQQAGATRGKVAVESLPALEAESGAQSRVTSRVSEQYAPAHSREKTASQQNKLLETVQSAS